MTTNNQTSDDEKFKQNMRKVWCGEAETWKKWCIQNRIRTKEATSALVSAARISPGMKVLDIACGAGDPAIPIASFLKSSGGQVIGTDLVQEMVDVAVENARREGLSNISFRRADAESLPFPDGSFDVVTSRFGVMFFSNVQRALNEIKRVLKPGGRVVLMAWGPKERNENWQSTIGVVIKHVRLPSKEENAPDPYRFSERGKLLKELENAGFKDPREDEVTINLIWEGSIDTWFEQFMDTWKPMGAFDGASPEDIEKIRRECMSRAQKYRDGTKISMKCPLNITSGVKPS